MRAAHNLQTEAGSGRRLRFSLPIGVNLPERRAPAAGLAGVPGSAKIRLQGISVRRTLVFPGLVALLFLLIGLAAGSYVYRERSHSVSEHFYVAAVTETRTLAAQIKQNLAQLNAMVSYFAASERVREAEFYNFSSGVLSKSLQGQTIVWTSVVPADGLNDFVSEIRRDNPHTHGDFTLNMHGRPAGELEVPGLGLFVGTYSRPATGRSYSGWVVDPKSPVAQTMLRAISKGRPNISSIQINTGIVPELADQPSVVMTMPVFSGEGRSRVLKGLLTAIVPVPVLAGVDEQRPLNPDIRFRIVDRDFGGAVLYDLSRNRLIPEPVRPGAVRHPGRLLAEPVEVVNRLWTLVAEPAEGAFTDPVWPSAVAVTLSLLLGLCLAYMLWRHQTRLDAARAEAHACACEVAGLANRAGQLEADLRQKEEAMRAMRGECDAALEQSRHDRRLLESLLNRLPQGVCIIDSRAKLVAWNRQVPALLDISDGSLSRGSSIGDILQQVIGAGPDMPATESWQSFFSSAASGTDEARLEITTRAGAELGVLRAPAPNGDCMLILSPMTTGKTAPVELRRKTHYDELTGLLARPRFEDVLSKAMRGRRSSDTGLALVLVDIDEMGVVNDAYGHDVGDEVLATIADILRRHIRETDIAARLEGDRFALLFSAIDDVRMVMGRTEQLLQEIWQPLDIQGNRLQVSVNMGIAMYPNQAIDPETLMRLADGALDRAKKNKRKNVFIADTVPHTVGTRPSTATKH